MDSTPTLHEARIAADTLVRFLDHLGGMFGSVTRAPTTPSSPATRRIVAEIVASTWIQRVGTILRESSRPLRPADITEEYRKRGWPAPAGRTKLGNMIRSTLVYAVKKGVAKRTADGTYVASQ